MEQRNPHSPGERPADCNAGSGGLAGILRLQERLTGALIGLARGTNGNEHLIAASTDAAVREGLCATAANGDISAQALTDLIARVEAEKFKLVPDCATCTSPCGRTSNYDLGGIWNAEADIRSLKSLLLFGIRGMAALACQGAALGRQDAQVQRFLYKALFVLGEQWDAAQLLPVLMEFGQVNLRCMALLEQAE